jgi:hypothetical protein
MGKSRTSISRKRKQTEFVRRRKERTTVLAVNQAEEYRYAFVTAHEQSSKRKEELEFVKKELQEVNKKLEEIKQHHEKLKIEYGEQKENEILVFVKERWEEEREIFEKEKRDLIDNNKIIHIQLNRLKEDYKVSEARIKELEEEVEDLEEDIDKLEKDKSRLQSRLARNPKK